MRNKKRKYVPSNNYVEMDINLIKSISKSYNLKTRVIDDTTIEIISKFDIWYADIIDNKFIMLRHRNNRIARNREHAQNVYFDFNFMFKSISEHDDNKLNKWYDRYNNSSIGMAFEKIQNGEIPYLKLN